MGHRPSGIGIPLNGIFLGIGTQPHDLFTMQQEIWQTKLSRNMSCNLRVALRNMRLKIALLPNWDKNMLNL